MTAFSSSTASLSSLARIQGALVGLATGDALGTTLEFKPPGSFAPLTDMVGGGPFGLEPGQWTDDTSLALCLAESLVERQGFDPVDQLTRYVRWYRHGYWSVTGACFDIGNTTCAALERFEATGDPQSGPTDPNTAGNGSLMRLAPAPLAYWRSPKEAVEKSGASSRTTHGAPDCVAACRYFGGLLVGALQGHSKEELLAPRFVPRSADDTGPVDLSDGPPLPPAVQAVADGSFRTKEPPAICGRGYVVDSLEAALWAFAKTDNFRDGALLVVNLGDDADTTGAIYGQIAGATYGLDAIPSSWRDLLSHRDEILALATQIHRLSERLAPSS